VTGKKTYITVLKWDLSGVNMYSPEVYRMCPANSIKLRRVITILLSACKVENLTQKPLNVFWFDEDNRLIKTKLFLCLIKHRGMKRYKAVKLVLHAFLSALVGGECLASLPVRFIHINVFSTLPIEGKLGLKTDLDATGSPTLSSQVEHPVVWSLS
jgi:hypothetical protein